MGSYISMQQATQPLRNNAISFEHHKYNGGVSSWRNDANMVAYCRLCALLGRQGPTEGRQG